MSSSSMAKTSAECSNSSCVKKSWDRFVQLAGPPANHRSDARKFLGFYGFQHAQQIQIGFLRMIVAARRRTVQHNGLQIFSGCFLQPADNLR